MSQERDAAGFVTAFGGAGLVCCLTDFLLSGGGPWQAWSAVVGLGCAGGVLLAVTWIALLQGPSLMRIRRVGWCWFFMSLGYAGWLASDLGVFAKLGSRHHDLALLGLAASMAAGVGFFGLMWTFGRRPAAGDGPSASEEKPHARWVWWVLMVGAVAAVLVDRSFFPREHAAAHATCRAYSLSACGFFFSSLFSGRRRPRLDTLAFVVVGLASLLPFGIMRGAPAHWAPTLFATPMVSQVVASLRGLTDVDGDGVSGALWGGDCAPWDGERVPGAKEIPGDGVDQDCTGEDLIPRVVDPARVPLASVPAPRSVLLITVETLRADHLSLYGYSKRTSPALDERASKGMVFERAYTAGSSTSIAIPALLRGVFARRLRWERYLETTTDQGVSLAPMTPNATSRRSPPKGKWRELGTTGRVTRKAGERAIQVHMLPTKVNPPPISWWLQRRGMSTAAVVDDHFSEILDRATGVAAGFDVFVEGDQIEGTDDSDDAVVDLALATLSELPQGSPWFMWVHLFGPHVPSTKHPNTPSFGEGLVAEYDHEIHFVDEQIDRLLEGALARAPGAAYIVTADHGESLFANNRMHGFSLSDDEIHVPLIVGGEGIPATRVAAPVSTVDIVPTVLALTQTPMPDYLDGRSLLTDLGDARMLFSDAWRYNYDGSLAMELVGAFDATAKFVHSRRDNVVVMTDYAHPERSSEEAAQGVELRRYVDAVQEYLRAGPLMTSWSYRP